MNAEKLVVFGCEESYFFRAGQPFNGGETNYLPSLFPPSCQVIQGALRTALLEAHGADYTAYYQGRCSVCAQDWADCPVLSAVGPADSQGKMSLDLRGPFVVERKDAGWERLYPVPLDLVAHQGGGGALLRLQPGQQPCVTDLGSTILPAVPSGAKELTGAWMKECELLAYLRGEDVSHSALFWEGTPFDPPLDQVTFLDREDRIGIDRDAVTRAATQHMLYAVQHVRFRQDFGLGVRVGNMPNVALPSVGWLGGERRLTSLRVMPAGGIPSAQLAESISQGQVFWGEHTFKVVFLTPGRFEQGWLPDGFQETSVNGVKAWEGELNGIRCKLVTACVGKGVRLGGWDMWKQKPKPARVYFPGGSVYYFTTRSTGEEVVAAMHDQKIGLDTRLGYGHIVVGRW